METMDFTEQRDDLLQAIQRDQEEVRGAIHELADAAQVKLSLSEHIKQSPLTWVIGGFVVGLWLGVRSDSHTVTGENNGARNRHS
ncbi:MAG: hypothetical protein ACRDL7_08575 [Gaiellaceae bacterium]